jgi:hypothetical protein
MGQPGCQRGGADQGRVGGESHPPAGLPELHHPAAQDGAGGEASQGHDIRRYRAPRGECRYALRAEGEGQQGDVAGDYLDEHLPELEEARGVEHPADGGDGVGACYRR